MQKKNNRIHQRAGQRQSQRRRTVLIIVASGMACLSVVLTIFFNTSQVQKSMAAVNVYMVADENPVIDMTLDAPVIKQLPPIGPNTLLVRAVKANQAAPLHHHE